MTVRGLNDNRQFEELKNLFKSAALSASTRPNSLRDFYVARVENGMRPINLTFGAENCRDQFGHLEERNRVRTPNNSIDKQLEHL